MTMWARVRPVEGRVAGQEKEIREDMGRDKGGGSIERWLQLRYWGRMDCGARPGTSYSGTVRLLGLTPAQAGTATLKRRGKGE